MTQVRISKNRDLRAVVISGHTATDVCVGASMLYCVLREVIRQCKRIDIYTDKTEEGYACLVYRTKGWKAKHAMEMFALGMQMLKQKHPDKISVSGNYFADDGGDRI